MSRQKTFMVPTADDAEDREAPSSVIHACKNLIKWQFLLGFASMAAGLAAAWDVLLEMRWDEAVAVLNGRPAVLDDTGILVIAGILAFLPLLNAVAFFRCGTALQIFSQSRMVSDLHPAMCRLRAAWRMAGVTWILMMALPPLREALVGALRPQ